MRPEGKTIRRNFGFSVTAQVAKLIWFNFSKAFSCLVGWTLTIVSKNSSFCCHFTELWSKFTFLNTSNAILITISSVFITSDYVITIWHSHLHVLISDLIQSKSKLFCNMKHLQAPVNPNCYLMDDHDSSMRHPWLMEPHAQNHYILAEPKGNINKTADNHRNFFRFLTLLNVPFRSMKAFSWKRLPSANFDNFSKLKIFWFPQITLNSHEKKTFSWEKYHLTGILQQICKLYQFWKNQVF